MQKQRLLFLFLVCIFVSGAVCDASTKRGIGASFGTYVGVDRFDNKTQYKGLNASWYYTWSLMSLSYVDGLAFIPMYWNSLCETDPTSPKCLALLPHGSEALLGYNEPDIDPCNMSVEEALAAWPQLVANAQNAGIPLIGSPAVAMDPVTNAWLPQFMASAGDTIDFVTLHWYKGINASLFISDVRALINAYNKPVWVTEFSPLEWTYWLQNASTFTEDQMFNFLDEVLTFMESEPMVHRYAMFSWPNGTASLWSPDSGELTKLGAYYGNFQLPGPPTPSPSPQSSPLSMAVGISIVAVVAGVAVVATAVYLYRSQRASQTEHYQKI